MADTTTELEVLDQIVDVLGGQSGQYETVVPVLQQIKELLAAGITDPEAIAEAVTAWLDEHPEATTTVRDGSITVMKLAQDVIELLDDKADIDGYYSQLTAGLAENLICRGDAVPAEYLYRTAGGEADIEDGIATIDCIKGQTLVWNQISDVSASSVQGNGSTISKNGNTVTALALDDANTYFGIRLFGGSVLTVGHKYLFATYVDASSLVASAESTKYRNVAFGQGGFSGNVVSGNASTVNSGYIKFIYEAQQIAVMTGYVNATAPTEVGAKLAGQTFSISNPQLFDLTLMFGAGNEPATVEEFEALFPLPYYPYSEPMLLSVNMKGIETVGFNLWDEEWESGTIRGAEGTNVADANKVRSKNYIRVIPNQTYHMKMPNTASVFMYDADKNYIKQGPSWNINSNYVIPDGIHFIRFTFGSSSTPVTKIDEGTICINLVWSGYRNGEYEEHWSAERPIDTSRFFPTGLKKVGDKADALYADHYDTVIGAVDLGTLTWNLQIGSTQNYFRSNTYDWLVAGVNNVVADVKCAKYEAAAPNNIADKTINVSTKNRLVIRDDSFNDDVSAFAASLNGVILYYELATPTTTKIDPPLNLSYKVSDFGTERIMVDETADAPQSAPVPMDVEYGINATDTVRRLPTQYISHESFQQFVAALQSAVGITVTETWDENDGRYEYTVTQTGE